MGEKHPNGRMKHHSDFSDTLKIMFFFSPAYLISVLRHDLEISSLPSHKSLSSRTPKMSWLRLRFAGMEATIVLAAASS